ncbi:hypothetical protein SS50377_28051 [Spironucleus salmonicida]|nr:hypothetical protein SS50377_28051 [Spironucleus salmonicida]
MGRYWARSPFVVRALPSETQKPGGPQINPPNSLLLGLLGLLGLLREGVLLRLRPRARVPDQRRAPLAAAVLLRPVRILPAVLDLGQQLQQVLQLLALRPEPRALALRVQQLQVSKKSRQQNARKSDWTTKLILSNYYIKFTKQFLAFFAQQNLDFQLKYSLIVMVIEVNLQIFLLIQQYQIYVTYQNNNLYIILIIISQKLYQFSFKQI